MKNPNSKVAGVPLIPIIVATFVNIAVVAFIIYKSGSPFIYPLDDTYIHMAIARNIAEYGVWGINPFDRAAASSSPLFTVLLTIFYTLFGHSELYAYVPLAFNIAALIACIACWAFILGRNDYPTKAASNFTKKSFEDNPRILLLHLIILSIFTPIFAVTVIGMEHTAHIALISVLLYAGAKLATAETEQGNSSIAALFFLSFFAVAVRYESLAISAPLVAVAFLNKKHKYCLALIAGSAAPVLAFGVTWVLDGGWILPNSILMKTLQNTGGRTPQASLASKTLICVTLFSAATLIAPFVADKRIKLLDLLRDWRAVFTLTVVMASAAVLKTGAVGWLYRYEAALISVNILSILLFLGQSYSKQLHYLVLLALTAVLPVRTLHAAKLLVDAADDRRWEHLGPATFVNNFAGDQAIVVNDIGLLAWLSPRARVLDMAGLANNDIASFRMETDGLTPQKTAEWARTNHAELAILQICWKVVSASIPNEWQLVSVWQGPRNAIFADVHIGFFATHPDSAGALRANLKRFSPPEGVRTYFVDEPSSPYFGATSEGLRQNGCQGIRKTNQALNGL